MLKNKLFRVIALVATVCCLGGAVTGLTLFAVNSRVNATAIDTAYTQDGNQQYVIRFNEPKGVSFALQSRQRKKFSGYVSKEQSEIASELKEAYAILDIKKYTAGVPENENWYDIAIDKDSLTSLEDTFVFYCSSDSTVQSFSLSFDNGGTSSDLYDESGERYIVFENWSEYAVPVVTATAIYKTVTYSVTHTEGGNFIFTGNTTAEQGKNYSFSVKPYSGYEIKSVTYSVGGSEKGNAIALTNGEYFIPSNDVTDNISIEIEVEAASYLVTFIEPVGAYFEKQVDDDGYERINAPLSLTTAESTNTKIRLTANDGYTVSSATVLQGGAVLDGSGDGTHQEYTLQSVTAPVTVTAQGVVQKTYTVTQAAEAGSGFDIEGLESSVTHGSFVTFTVNVTDSGKEIEKVSYTMVGTAGEKTLTSSNNTYTIPNVTGNVEIKVTLKDKTYTLTLTAADGSYFATDNMGTTHTGTATATHGQSTTLYLFAEPHYDASKASLILGGATDDPISGSVIDGKNGVSFTIDSNKITANTTVTVRGVVQKAYTVTLEYDGVTGYEVRSLSPLVDLHYGDRYQFTVTAKIGFTYIGYTVSASNTDTPEQPINITPDRPADTETNTFTLAVNGNITVTVQQNEEAVQKYTVSSAKSNSNCTIKVDGNVLGTSGNDQVDYNNTFNFTVEANDGYHVTSVHVGNDTLTPRNGSYNVTVTNNIEIEVETAENALTVTYQNASGGTDTTTILNWTQLAGDQGSVTGESIVGKLRDAKTASGNTSFTYLVSEWWTTGDNRALFDKTSAQNIAETLKTVDTTLTLRLHYSVNTEKAKELLRTFYAYYRNDDEVGKDPSKSYFIYRMEIDSNAWKSFLAELNTVGASLTAVGFTYTNSSTYTTRGIDDYTASDIAGYYNSMPLATGAVGGKVDERLSTDGSGAQLWLFGYRWDLADSTKENQVQFISGVKAGARRHFRGWFMFSLNGVSTVVMGDSVTTDTTWTTKGPKPQEGAQAEAAPTKSPSVSDVGYEGPTIE